VLKKNLSVLNTETNEIPAGESTTLVL
jgi:hypothetical protein